MDIVTGALLQCDFSKQKLNEKFDYKRDMDATFSQK
jgi:hypothetical protein